MVNGIRIKIGREQRKSRNGWGKKSLGRGNIPLERLI
jgi:hypothetical protein